MKISSRSWATGFLAVALLFSGTGVLEKETLGTGVRAETLYTQDRIQLNPAIQAATPRATQPSAYEPTTQFLSPILTADFAFDAIGVEWEQSVPQGTSAEFYLRVRPVGKTAGEWAEWIEVDPDIDFKEGTKSEDLKEVSKLVPTTRAQKFQYKVVLESPEGTATPRIQKVRFHYIDGQAGARSEAVAASGVAKDSLLSVPSSPLRTTDYRLQTLNKLTFGSSSFSVIPRSAWAADETWRTRSYFGLEDEETASTEDVAQELQELEQAQEQAGKNGEEKSLKELYPEEFELTQTVDKNEQGEALLWPMEYAKNTKKIIVHHTASTGNLDNPEAAMRAIYYYHAVRRGWGDIGYNYLIDPQGNIYEGRAGGERVVAGHAQGYNTGSIGIAVIGNYQENQVPYEVFEALSALIQDKADLYNIKIDGVSTFRGELFPNVMGHRDVASTACPGQKLYDALPTLIRLMARQSTDLEGRLASQTTNKPYEFASISDYRTLRLNPQASTQLKIQLKNIGTETWNADTYLVADQNPSADRLLHWVRDSKNSDSIGSMMKSEGSGGNEVKPGETATFVLNAEATLRGGFENFSLTPIFNGVKKTTHYLDLPIYVDAPALRYEKVELTANATRVKPGQNVNGIVKLRNTGNMNWYATGTYSMRLGGTTAKPYATLKEPVVKPGEIGTFDFAFTARREAGRYRAALNPVIENADPMKGPKLEVEVIVYDTGAKGELVAISGSGGDERLELNPGEQRSMWIELKNTGDQPWEKLGKKRFTVGITRNPSIKLTKPILEKATVSPNETVRLRFTLTAPLKAGRYKVYLRPRLGSQNLMKKPITLNFSVKSTATAIPANTALLDQETIRIKLGFNPSTSGNPVIRGNGPYDLVLDGKTFLTLDSADSVEVRWMSDRYQILYDGQAWVVEGAPRFVPAAISETLLRIDNWSRPPAWNPSLNDNTFRGILEVREADGELTVINELPMEHYLRGIAEVENAAPREKIRTLMVIARTYARYYLTEEEKFPGRPYHLSDNPDESQKYLGYGFEKRAPNIAQAVADTAGKVVTYNGKIVKTPYFSASDGTATKSAEEVWGWTHTPYLVSVPDPLCTTSKTFQGHGVGLSGCGATAAAERGYTYEEIIKYYYTGVEIEVQ